MPCAPNLYDSHMHTPLCKHARGLPGDYAAQAQRVGLRGITITCHSPMPFGWNPAPRMAIHQLSQYLDMVYKARDDFAERVDVRLGMECDYLPGFESWLDELQRRADFSYMLGSVHPQTEEYRQLYLEGASRLEYERSYFENLARAAESGLFDCLSHPDIVKNCASKAIQIRRSSVDRAPRAGPHCPRRHGDGIEYQRLKQALCGDEPWRGHAAGDGAAGYPGGAGLGFA